MASFAKILGDLVSIHLSVLISASLKDVEVLKFFQVFILVDDFVPHGNPHYRRHDKVGKITTDALDNVHLL